MSVTLITNLGRIKFELECKKCPKTCENFLALCAKGYYNNTIFHRNIKEFMIQGGDPTGTGKGGQSIYPGGKFEDELTESLKHNNRGILSMANNGVNTSRSQFFITYGEHEQLDNTYTVFGRIINPDGFETLNRMEGIPSDEKDRPKSEIKILKCKIHANPFALGLIESHYEKLTSKTPIGKRKKKKAKKKEKPTSKIPELVM